MKLQTILFRLKNIQEETNENKRKENFDNLVYELEQNIKMEVAKSKGDQNRLKSARQVLKEGLCKSRDILKKAIIKDDKMILTNGYVAFELKDFITGIETHDNSLKESYPDIKRVMEKQKDFKIFSVLELKQSLSVLRKNEAINLNITDNLNLKLNSTYLEQIINILDFNKNDVITIYFNAEHKNTNNLLTSNIYIENKENKAVIVPMNS